VKILVVGGGGREHALVWKIAQSPKTSRIYAAPGNAGIQQLAQCVPISAMDIPDLLDFARVENIDLTVVGPEVPLEMGIVDRFQESGLKIFGPSQEAALLETSKVFAKAFMDRHDIPTAGYEIFESTEEACRYVRERGAPVVVKADGLAAGKGSLVAQTIADAQKAIRWIMEEKAFGRAGERVVVEEFLTGEEASILALVDGRDHLVMIPSQDHKAIYEGDRGPNTGGMGAYAPAPVITEALMIQIEERILQPAIVGMEQEGRPYRGILYAGLMVTATGPQVVEFNCRFGDPETQAVLPLLEDDLVELMLAVCDGTLGNCRARWSSGAAVCVVMASEGYPGPYQRGVVIHGLDRFPTEDVVLFHAGTKRGGSRVLTDGGRVLGVTGLGRDVQQAVDRAYQAVQNIVFQGAYYRRDIAYRALAREGMSSRQAMKGGEANHLPEKPTDDRSLPSPTM
jgi:phosphoribosylamine--glycine ligase